MFIALNSGFVEAKIVGVRHSADRKQHVGADMMATYYLDRGDLDRAFAWFDRAVSDHSDGLLYLKVQPLYDPARKDPRFQALLKRVGLE